VGLVDVVGFAQQGLDWADWVEGVVYQLGEDLYLQLLDGEGLVDKEFDSGMSGLEPFRFRAERDGDFYLRVASSGWGETDFDLYLGLVEIEKETGLEVARQYMQTLPEQAPGAVVAIWQDGEVIFQSARGVANVNTGTPLDFDSVSPAPFLDRQFLIYGTLELIRTGELQWDQKIGELLPWFPKFGLSVTVDHLFHRRTGLRSSEDLAQLVLGNGQA
jgi:beta-lactamase family protein